MGEEMLKDWGWQCREEGDKGEKKIGTTVIV